MKLRTVLIVVCALGSTLPAMANGPGMSEDSGTSSNAANMNPERERWTRHRIEHLQREHQRQEERLKNLELSERYNAPYRFLNGENPLNVTEADRRQAEIVRQREINTIEYLSLKKERGELSPAGQRHLRALIRSVRAGH